MSSPIFAIERTRLAGVRLALLWDVHGRGVAGAMTTTGAGALASGLVSAVAVKILATSGGPSALATLVTLQQVRQAAIVAATVNGQTALIQGASARAAGVRREYVRTAAILFLGGAVLVAAALVVFPGALRQATGLALLTDSAVRWLAAGAIFSSVFVFLAALLNVQGRIGTLAALQVGAPLTLAVGMWPVAKAIPNAGPLAILLAATSLTASLAAAWPLVTSWACWRDWVRGSGALFSKPAARAFLSISAAMLVSGLMASATVIAVRRRIIADQGLGAAGWFDAAWSISMNQASLLVASLQTYCLPALSRAKSAREQSAQITGMLLVAMPAAAAIIAVLALAKPWVLELFYAPSFRPAAALLRWTLVGDYLKIGSWILSLPLLARADMKAFLLLDTAAYATFAGASVILSRWLGGAESAAAAFACMYAVHLAAGAVLAHRRCGIRLERPAVAVWSAGLAVVALVSGCSWNRL